MDRLSLDDNTVHSNDENGKAAVMQFDGGSRGNPGIAGCGYVITINPNTLREERVTGSLSIGTSFTNNYAEYMGLIEGARCSRRNGVEHIHIEGDSLLVIQQLSGKWKVRSESLLPLYQEAKSLLSQFKSVSLQHIPREQNKEADQLANLAMDAVCPDQP